MRKECQFVLVRKQNSQQWDGGIRLLHGPDYFMISIHSFIFSYVHLYAHVMHSWHSCVHQRIFLTTWNRFGAHKPTWFLAPFAMHIFCQSQSYFMLPDYKYAFCCYQGDPLFVVVYLPSGSLFWVRSLWSIWECNTSRFHLGCWISKWVTGVFLWNGVPSPGSWSLGHMPFVVLICFLVTCHTHMYLHLSVLMIGQLLCNNFVCMAIKIFWLELDLILCTYFYT